MFVQGGYPGILQNTPTQSCLPDFQFNLRLALFLRTWDAVYDIIERQLYFLGNLLDKSSIKCSLQTLHLSSLYVCSIIYITEHFSSISFHLIHHETILR